MAGYAHVLVAPGERVPTEEDGAGTILRSTKKCHPKISDRRTAFQRAPDGVANRSEARRIGYSLLRFLAGAYRQAR